ncbi:hypothetical protein O1L60_35600 [Streptomyces diastatochromogenes]|nr:hypothetical protein [Streptomyces diastatochromogenes]
MIELCVSLVDAYGLDGLKLDFLDEAAVYAGDGAGDVGRAMAGLLAELRRALEAVRPGLLLELRQPYTGPGMAPFGNMLRSVDCPRTRRPTGSRPSTPRCSPWAAPSTPTC